MKLEVEKKWKKNTPKLQNAITNLYHHEQIDQTPKQILQWASDSNKQPPCSPKRS